MDGYVAKIIAHDSRVAKAIITWQGILQLLEAVLRIENFENDVTVVANFDNGESGLRDGVKFRGGGGGNHSGTFWKLRMVVTCISQRCIERYLHVNISSFLVYSFNDIFDHSCYN